MAGWGLTVLRVAVGLLFCAHGARRLSGFVVEGGATPSDPLSLIWAIVQVACGALLVLGAWTRWAALPLAIGTAVAVARVAPAIGTGDELNLVLLAACVCLSLAGAGELSIDNLLHRNAESAYAGRQRIRGM